MLKILVLVGFPSKKVYNFLNCGNYWRNSKNKTEIAMKLQTNLQTKKLGKVRKLKLSLTFLVHI